MTAQECLDRELERRGLDRLKPATIAEVRRLCRHPHSGIEVIYDRLLVGNRVLDQQETDDRWQLWELLMTAHECCKAAIQQQRIAAEEEYIRRLHTEPALQESQRRLRATNHRSMKAHLAHEQKMSGIQVPLPNTEHRPGQPTLKRRTLKG